MSTVILSNKFAQNEKPMQFAEHAPPKLNTRILSIHLKKFKYHIPENKPTIHQAAKVAGIVFPCNSASNLKPTLSPYSS